ncbi:hypothetical protein GWO43_31330 [candidate division KSB1 bacterium]|nr:hypothetical protein [candidate division KSB1 bacterium]NIR73394.1 hypothetical protein [candidate division KSB1 bacterium]NIS28393.1 hypothetical protein [candidate division KSB1 bacterium]NIT75274.1 hypothetical protein [candidate division KSB1 bacterium]NIU29121.1 hypothetical protein [candidate division KSB1 bacterium]
MSEAAIDIKKIFYRRYLPAILWAALIFVGSSIPSQSMPKFTIETKDLVLHFIEYALFGVFLAIAFISSSDRISWKPFNIALLVGVVYAALDELHQKFVSGRVCAFTDFVADSLGVLFGLALFIAVLKTKERFTG